MKCRWIRPFVNLYPTAWRQRYGAEYLALLEEATLTWRDACDILRGALDAHLHPELAGYGRWLMKQNRIFRIGGAGAILSAVLLVLALLNSQRLPESESEFLLLISPVALLPVAVALHFLFRNVAPRFSRVTAVLGLLSMGIFLLAAIVGMIGELLPLSLALLQAWLIWFFQGLIALMGVWLLLSAYLGWRTHGLPAAMPALMLTGGLGWLVMFVGIMLNSQGNHQLVNQLSALMGLGLVVWMIAHAMWTVWLGVWLWLQYEPAAAVPPTN